MSALEILLEHRAAFAAGLLVTLKLTLLVWGFGLSGGCLLAAGAKRWRRAVGIPLSAFGFLLSGVPILVLLFWLHYPVQEILEVVIDPFLTAVVALASVNALLVAFIVRNALDGFPQQYITAAVVCGMPSGRIWRRIQIPLLMRQVVPPLVILQVIMLQSTLFASLISVNEVFRVAQRINAIVYQPVEVYTGLALLFLLMCLPLNALSLYLRARFGRDVSER